MQPLAAPGSTLVPCPTSGADDAATASEASTTRVTPEPLERGFVQGSVTAEGQGSGDQGSEGCEGRVEGSTVPDVASFLSSDEGTRAYHMWSRGVLSTVRARDMYGAKVVDAFETHYVAAQQLLP